MTEFPDLDENTRATTFYSTGTTGLPKGVYFSHRQLVLHTLASLATITSANQGRLCRDDVYMPLTPMFHVHAWGIPYVATMIGVKQVYPGRYIPEVLLRLLATEGVTFSHCVPSILNMLVSDPAAAHVDLSGWKVLIGGAALPRTVAAQGARAWHRRLGRLRSLRIRSGAGDRQPERRAAQAAPRGAGGAAHPHGHADRAGRPEGGRRARPRRCPATTGPSARSSCGRHG